MVLVGFCLGGALKLADEAVEVRNSWQKLCFFGWGVGFYICGVGCGVVCGGLVFVFKA